MFHRHALNSKYFRSKCKKCHAETHSYEARNEYLKNYNKEYVKKPENQMKIVARRKVIKAISMGELGKPSICSECFSEGQIEAHHEDYSKPLDVLWLCKKCHYKADKN